MAVKIRERKLKDGNTISLYYDFYIQGQRFTKTSEYRIYLDEPKSIQKKKRENANREGYVLESQYLKSGVDEMRSHEFKSHAIFNEFFWDYCKTKNNKHTHSVWLNTIRHFEIFAGKEVKFKKIDKAFCQAFLDYLLSHNADVLKDALENVKNDKEKHAILLKNKLANSTIRTYYFKFQSTIKEAFRQRLLKEDYTYNVKRIPKDDRHKNRSETLTLEEIRLLNNHTSKHDSFNQAKNALVFSCLSGLRYSDCFALKWGDIYEMDNPTGDEKLYIMDLLQQKTGERLHVPIFQSTLDIAGKRKPNEEKVFNLSKYNSVVNRSLHKVFKEAGLDSLIRKNITTHKARHTFGVTSRNSGVDIGIVQKLMGHRNSKSTEIYARLETTSLIKALDMMPKL